MKTTRAIKLGIGCAGIATACLSAWLPSLFAAQDMAAWGLSLRDPGVCWITTDYLPVSEAGESGYDWSQADRFVLLAQKRGLRILARPFVRSQRPVTSRAYFAALAAAVERYDHDGRDDMPGLRQPVGDWVVDGALNPESARPDDPQALADFAAEAYRTIRAADPRSTVILAAGLCELQSGSEPVVAAEYFRTLLARLGRRLGPASCGGFALGFHLAAEESAHDRLAAFADFLHREAERGGMAEARLWLLDVSLSEPRAAAYAAEMLKIHLCGLTAGWERIFFFTPLSTADLERDPAGGLDAFQRAHQRSLTDAAFKLAASYLARTDWPQARIRRDGARWEIVFKEEQLTFVAAWNETPPPAGEESVAVGVQNGLARLDRLVPEGRLMSGATPIDSGRVVIPASSLLTLITIPKDPEDCHCKK